MRNGHSPGQLPLFPQLSRWARKGGGWAFQLIKWTVFTVSTSFKRRQEGLPSPRAPSSAPSLERDDYTGTRIHFLSLSRALSVSLPVSWAAAKLSSAYSGLEQQRVKIRLPAEESTTSTLFSPALSNKRWFSTTSCVNSKQRHCSPAPQSNSG